jgi:hypothetical protein
MASRRASCSSGGSERTAFTINFDNSDIGALPN